MPVNRGYAHTVVVGGTGMLLAASTALAARSRRLTSVARTLRSLARLDAAVRGAACAHHVLALDWNAADRFLQAIERHLEATEPPDLVLAWIHDDDLTIRLACRLAAAGRPPLFVHVVGSATSRLIDVADAARERLVASGAAVAYRQVVLGARPSGGTMRWLTHEEISRGVVDAIDSEQERFVVGVVPAA